MKNIKSSPPKKDFSGIMLVGDAPGMDEISFGIPFIGHAGQELTRMLREAQIDRATCHLTNVFMEQPPGNKLDNFCGKKAEVGGKDYTLPPLSMGKYFLPEHLHHVHRLWKEIEEVNPTLIIALGNVASWALLGKTKINKLRGTLSYARKWKCLPTYHPAAIYRQWGLRPIMMQDLHKAKKEAAFPEIKIPNYTIHIPETLAELSLEINKLYHAEELSLDIETRNGQMTCIGFSANETDALVVPIATKVPPYRYWNACDELIVRKLIKKLLNSPAKKVGQNGLYDLQYLWREGSPVNNYVNDTMLLHHCMYPELPKGLGFLGSVYTNAPSWKEMRTKETQEKADE